MPPETKPCPNTASSPNRLQDFQSILAAYRGSNPRSSTMQLVSTLALLGLSWIAMYLCLSVSYWLTLALAVPSALLMVRLFILQHDCGHRSFFRSRRANDIVGFCLGILTFTPYECWRRQHALHHACSGDLDRRGKAGEILTMTVEEYRSAHWFTRLYYRAYRHPVVLFGIGAFYQFTIHQRFPFQVPKTWKKERRSVHLTNVGILLVVLAGCWAIGPWNFLIIELPVMFLAAGIGVWLFYMQHQYEDAFWERSKNWDFVDAALAGSSYYRLPKILQWFTGNIGLHHIHHLDARIPNYRLQPCHDANPQLQQVHEISLVDGIACISAKLWDEEQGKMVGFKDARRPQLTTFA